MREERELGGDAQYVIRRLVVEILRRRQDHFGAATRVQHILCLIVNEIDVAKSQARLINQLVLALDAAHVDTRERAR